MSEENTAEEGLAGGNMNAPVRRGERVHRAAGPWTPTIHALLRHVRAGGLAWAPEPFGFDEQGREVIAFVEGDVYNDELPGWIWTDEVLAAAARMLRAFHDAAADFRGQPGRPPIWQLPTHEPAETICHNDFAPYNWVFRDRRLVSVIDWDTASPGSRIGDLAYLAYRLVPLADPTNPEALLSTDGERRRRLKLACEAYGGDIDPNGLLDAVDRRLDELADFTLERAKAGGPAELFGHVELYRADADWVREFGRR